MLTVTVPAESQRLTTLAAVKGELRLSGGADDEYLSDLIDRASAAVRQWCNRVFAPESVSETFRLPHHGNRPDVLTLTRWPVVSVASVSEAGTALAAAGYETDAERGLVYRLDDADNPHRWAAGKIVIEYRAGYVLPGTNGRTLPDDIERATMLLVKADYFARTRDPLVKSEDVAGALNTTFWVGGFSDGGNLPPDVAGLLSQHRQPAIG